MSNSAKPGDVYSFETNIENEYGIIQVISRGKIGINIRVFYDLIRELADTNLNSMIESNNFYYIRDFFEYELLNKSNMFLGNYKIPSFVKMPRYMRLSERQNSKLSWYIIDTDTSKTTSASNVINSDFDKLSPANTWGIDYIKKRWQEGFTLSKWSDFEELWYQKYLEKYEPEILKNNDTLDCLKFKKIKPTIIWKKYFDKNGEVSELRKPAIDEIDQRLDVFIDSIELDNLNSINKALDKLMNELNVINQKYSFIETEESEKLIEFIESILQTSEFYDDVDDYNRLRNW